MRRVSVALDLTGSERMPTNTRRHRSVKNPPRPWVIEFGKHRICGACTCPVDGTHVVHRSCCAGGPEKTRQVLREILDRGMVEGIDY